MTDGLSRAAIFPEPALPDFDGLIAEASNTSLPVDVGDELAAAGAVVWRGVGDMLARLSDMAGERGEALL